MTLVRKLFTNIVAPLLITVAMWLAVDASATALMGIRGFSLFYASDQQAGHINKPNFSGRFGGPLDSFSSVVNIGPLGERKSSPLACPDVPFVLFVGDSTTAGFEVADDETFVSRLNRDCASTRLGGANFGVRATDTHEVLGNYKRVAKALKHDAVLYLISDNDLSENLRQYHYINIAQRFGRVFNGEFLKPPVSRMGDAYLDLRIFVSDRFYFTTKLIEVLERWRAELIGNQAPVVVDGKVPDEQADVLIRLLRDFAAATRENGARLYVALYPCVSPSGCEYVQLESKLSAAAANDFVVLPLASNFDAKFASNAIHKEQMRFRNDSHLSAFGHQVVADELSRLLAAKPPH